MSIVLQIMPKKTFWRPLKIHFLPNNRKWYTFNRKMVFGFGNSGGSTFSNCSLYEIIKNL